VGRGSVDPTSDRDRYPGRVLDPDHAEDVARQFRLGSDCALTGTAERGEQGWIWQMQTSRGLWAVKTAIRPPDRDGEDAAFQTAARAKGVPAPGVVRTRGGEVFAQVADMHVRVFEWVDLLPPDRDIDPAAVGGLLAAIHRVPFTGRRPRDDWYEAPVGAARWDQLAAGLAAADAPIAAELAAMRDDLVELEALIEPPAELRTCHRDLWADNIRPTTGGGLCVIDWDNCGLADPSHEVGKALFEFAYRRLDRAATISAEYRRRGGPGRVTRRGDFSMTIAELGHINEMSCRSWLDPDDPPEERERQAARFRESVEQPLTVAVIDELLAAVAD
jgi:Phosphotransferase enzyme family